MHGLAHDLVRFLLLIAGAVAMPVVSGRIRVPSAVLLIGYGVAMGPHALGLIDDGTVVGFLSDIGFIVLMFLAGLEIDFNVIRQRGQKALVLLMGICLTIAGLALAAALLLGLVPIYGLALGAVGVGMPLAVLKETGMVRSRVGQTVLVVGSVGEFLTLLGMTVLYFASRFGVSLQLVIGIGKFAAVLLAAVLTLRMLVAVAWWHPRTFSRLVEQHDGAEIGVRAALLLMMGFSVAAVLAGVEAIVGAFIAGALIAFVLRGKDVLEQKLSVVGHGLFVPIFFTVVGVRFDPASVTPESLELAVLLLGAALLVKTIPCAALLRQGLAWREAIGVSLLLATPLTLVVAIATLGEGLGILGRHGPAPLVLLAVLSGIAFPVAFRAVAVSRTRQEERPAR